MADRSPVASRSENPVAIDFFVTNRTGVDVRGSKRGVQLGGRGDNGCPNNTAAGVGRYRRRRNA